MTTQEVSAIFEALASGRADEFFEHVDDKVAWTVMGTHPLAGEYKSKAEFRKATFDRLAALFPDGIRLSVRDMLVDGEMAAVELTTRETANSGVKFDNDYCWICRFDGRRIVEVRAYLDSALVQKVIDEGSK